MLLLLLLLFLLLMMLLIMMMTVDDRRESGPDSEKQPAFDDAFSTSQVVGHCSCRYAHVYIRRTSGGSPVLNCKQECLELVHCCDDIN